MASVDDGTEAANAISVIERIAIPEWICFLLVVFLFLWCGIFVFCRCPRDLVGMAALLYRS